jgi:Mn-dependent DtxR family transcriptional regulator
MLALAALFGAASAVLGFHAALWLDCSTAGAIAVVSTVLFFAAWLGSPTHGVLPRLARRAQLAARIARENTLRALFSLHPVPAAGAAVALPALGEQLRLLPADLRRQCRKLARGGWVECGPDDIRLTEKGFHQAKRIVRAHRLWETFLVNEMGIALDHAHPDAEEIEHLLSERLLDRVDDLLGHPVADPHGQRIPRPPELLRPGTVSSLSMLRVGDRALVRGLDADAAPEMVERVASAGLPLGAEVEITERTADRWTVRCPDATLRTIDHQVADAVRVELRRPA